MVQYEWRQRGGINVQAGKQRLYRQGIDLVVAAQPHGPESILFPRRVELFDFEVLMLCGGRGGRGVTRPLH